MGVVTPPVVKQPSEPPLKYQKWVLKVSVHCQGCMRKVKNVLQTIDGVYTTTIDLQQQKVIVTGDVDANTLIRKLEKSGKRAELWPEKTENEGKKKKKKKKSKKKEPKSSEEDSSDSTEEEEEEVEVVNKEVTEQVIKTNSKVTEGDGTTENPGGSNGGKNKKKKKKKKAQNTNSADGVETPTVEVKGNVESPNLSGPVNHSPHMYPYPIYCHPPQYGVPMYGSSYNMAYPGTSYNKMYHSEQPSPYSYRYTPSYAPPPFSSMGMYVDDDDDGNVDYGDNGCSIM